MKEHTAEVRFYEELNDFLPLRQRKEPICYAFNGHPGIKDAIESLGVPHTEVDLIVVNGGSVGFDYQLAHGDRVAVYPVFESLDITPVVRLRDEPLRKTAFILDVHLGKLARILRMLGFDVLYRTDYDDTEIIRLSLAEHRIILTRDRRMLFHKCITHAHWLHSTHSEEQAREVIERFDLQRKIRKFLRCPLCNGLLQSVDKKAVLDRLEPLTRTYYDDFYQCPDCRQLYWKGTHYDRIADKLDSIIDCPGKP